MADLRAQVEARNDQYMQHFKCRDFKSLANMYTEDCTFMSPGTACHKGREGLAESLSNAAGSSGGSLKVQTEELIPASPDLIIERGASTLYRGDGTVMEDGKYLMIWKRVGSSLQILIDIWNRVKM